MLRPQRHQPDPFDRRDLPRDESRETVGFYRAASATALGIVYREGPGEVFTGALALPLALGGQWGLRGTPQGYRSASGLVPVDVIRAAATRQHAQSAASGFAPFRRAETAA
jgi:hypothetical protein